ncbi:MAG TPA: SLBB domain-containing protein [Rhizomicrobium sp.]|jgi:protein involved in polysaccharide export with SLBB domain|nr:SLBB domain-containing protein [Rhizomicrobium sp.]
MRWPSSKNFSRFLLFFAVLFAAASFVDLAVAQVGGSTDPDLLRSLQNRGDNDSDNRTLKPTIQVIQPAAVDGVGAPPSRLEKIYSDRLGTHDRLISQFGYNLLGVPTAVSANQLGATQEQYVLGQGDELSIQLRGQENSDFRARIDRNGQIVLPKLNPISAAGRTLGDVRADIEAAVARNFVSTKVFITVGQMRQITVIVTGDVRAPGVRTVGALASPLDALLLSGGVSKTGSLRAIQLIRGGTTRQIDLYSLLERGGTASLGTLQDGDKIFVPPIGATVAIVGDVKHEAIFELPRGVQSIDVRSLSQLAGGFEIAGTYRLTKLMLEPDGTTRQVAIANNGVVRSGEMLFVYANKDVIEDRVSLMGAVRLSGVRPRVAFATVGQLIHSVDDLDPDAYTLFAFIARRDRASNTKILIPISLYRIFRGDTDVPLQNDDIVYIMTSEQISKLATEANGSTVGGHDSGAPTKPGGDSSTPADSSGHGGGGPPQTLPTNDETSPVATPSGSSIPPKAPSPDNRPTGLTLTATNNSGSFTTPVGGRSPDAMEDAPQAAMIAQKLGVTGETVLHTITNNLVWVLGQVGDPRAYVAAPGTSLGDMLAAAGGTMRDSDLSSVEVTSTTVDPHSGVSRTDRKTFSEAGGDFKTVSIQPFDVIRVRPVFSERQDGNVVVTGAVRYPGTFDIIRGERLSSLLARAGGLTEQAYPYGAVFTRRSVAVAEKIGNEREARTLDSQLVTLVSGELSVTANSSSNNSGASASQFLSSLADQLRSAPALGRMSIITDPAVLAVNPANDILLEAGDTLYIPIRPSTVTVSGEVLSAGAFRFDPKFSVSDYIELAGGASQAADEGRIFVVLPDGSAAPRSENWLSFDHHAVPPGATIIVPRDLSPFNLSQFLVTATQIVSQLAISAASFSVVTRNN